MSSFVSAILLAAGMSKRAGKPKLLLPFADSTILGQATDALLQSKVDELIIVLGYKADELVSKIANRPAKIAVNTHYEEGMSTSIITGLGLVDTHAQGVMIALADHPLVDSKIIDRLVEEFQKHSKGIVVPEYQGRRGHPVIFSVKYKEELLALKGDVGGRQIINEHSNDIFVVQVDSDSVNVDIDTLSDYVNLTQEPPEARITFINKVS